MIYGGAILILLGLTLRAWSMLSLGFNWSMRLQLPREVVTDGGPYRYVRHPAYLGSLLTMAGTCLIDVRLAFMWLAVAFFLQRIEVEEAMLEQYPAYRAYQKTTNRFCPWRRKGT